MEEAYKIAMQEHLKEICNYLSREVLFWFLVCLELGF